MKIAVVTAYDDAYTHIGSMAEETMSYYAKQHGYSFRCFRSGFDKTRHPSWSKFHFTMRALHEADWVVWMDADVFVMNPEIRIEDLIDDEYSMICSAFVWVGPVKIFAIQSGLFIARNTPFTFDYFNNVLGDTRTDLPYQNRLREESVMTNLYMHSARVQNHIKLITMNKLTSFPQCGEAENMNVQHMVYRPGLFSVHLMLDHTSEEKHRLAQLYYNEWKEYTRR